MKPEKRNYPVLAHFLKALVTERFKRMAKDEVLFRFLTTSVEPAVLIDHYIQSEREALDLTEMSLLELVTRDRLEIELNRSAVKIQSEFELILRKIGFAVEQRDKLIKVRERWLDTRVDFYRKWLSLLEDTQSALDLALKTFRNPEAFEHQLTKVFEIDRQLADEVVKTTPSLYRFLMRKQFDFELKHSEEIWLEFKEEAFKKIAALPG